MSEIKRLEKVPEISFIDNMSLQETEQQVMELYAQNYKEITGTDAVMHDADPVNLTLKTVALVLYQVMQYIDAKGRAEMLKTAQGEALDNLAALLGVTRKPAERATVTLRFTLSAVQGGVIAIPAGTRAKTEGGVYFNTLEYAQVSAGALTVDVPAQAEEPGTAADAILPGKISTLVDPIAYVASVENVDESTGGTDTESDDDFTERIFLAPSVYSCAGPKDAYEYYAKAWRNDVADVQVTSPSDCVVAIYFMLAGGVLPSAAELAGMEKYMADEALRPMCDKVECHAPAEVGYSIDLTYWIASGEAQAAGTIQEAVNAAVEDYKAWQRILGRDINPTELIMRVRQAGAKRCAMTAPVYAAVEKTQVAKVTACAVNYGGLEDD